MRIGIDARFFGPLETGIGRYVERLIHHLEAIDHRNEYIVFLRAEAWDRWRPQQPNWRKVLADYRWYTFKEQLFLPSLYYRAGLDLLHVPHFNVPILYRRPFVVTIHDLILDQFRTERATTLEPIVFRAKFAAYRLVLRQAVRKARKIITVSEHSRQELRRRFALPADRIVVTYEGVDQLPSPVLVTDLARRGVKRPFLLHVGNSYPHKNLERLLAAWQQVSSEIEGQLVLVGKEDYFSRRLRDWAEQQGINRVCWFGFASDAELSALYRYAQAYIFPSLSEGFGLPGLEAMAAGIPVYAANASCLPEVFGPAAAYFDPLQVADIADSIRRAFRDKLEQQRLIKSGHERLRYFSWSTLARQTLTVYEQLAKRSPARS
ncbi:MAG: glycosyltransferase family 4 protein [Candidatus Kerfeldbacteria bacterium]|nr:glycosyltransferase family 4 protein [Candidatus Kerfeldbacteria bacterium]